MNKTTIAFMFLILVIVVALVFLFDTFSFYLGARRLPLIRPAVGTVYTANTSAYAPSPYQTQGDPCVTASGQRVGTDKVANNDFPFGTTLEIDGNQYIVADRMNARFKRSGTAAGSRIYVDLWFPSTSWALQYGRRTIEAEVVGYSDSAGQPMAEASQAEAEDSEPDSFWDAIKRRSSAWSGFLAAQVSRNPDRFDVAC